SRFPVRRYATVYRKRPYSRATSSQEGTPSPAMTTTVRVGAVPDLSLGGRLRLAPSLALTLGEHCVELGAGHGDLLVGGGGSRRRLLLVLFVVQALLELLRGLTEGTGQLGQAGGAEQEQDDDQDDDQLGSSEIHGATRLQAWARASMSSLLTREKGTAPGHSTSVATPSWRQTSSCSPTSSTVPT